MNIISSFLSELPIYLLSLPVVLMALSVHEMAHGYVAFKLGDPTARNLGRLTLNPIKHIDPIGFICMIIFRVGWAKPVPIMTRNFKKPRRDMAITGAAGPVANFLLAILHLLVLRVALIFISNAYADNIFNSLSSGEEFVASTGFTIIALIVYLLSLGVVLNVCLAVFNLIPVPPFDGSRIFYAFLPQKIYFAIMKYERIIMIVMLVLFALGFLSGPLNFLTDAIESGMYFLVGLTSKTRDGIVMRFIWNYVQTLLTIPL